MQDEHEKEVDDMNIPMSTAKELFCVLFVVLFIFITWMFMAYALVYL